MTSGIFHLIPLDDVVIRRDERQRRELDDIDVLADSIRRLGLIHPIVVTRDLELVAGERRTAACRALGWTNIPAQYADEIEPAKLHAIELEENIKRKDIPWQDQVRAVMEYHRLRDREEDGWTRADTSAALGVTPGAISYMLQVGQALEADNRMVVEAPKLSTAIGIVRRAQERQDQQVLDRLHNTFEGVTIERPPESIIAGNFNDWVLSDVGVRFNFIHCDFPYGIEADTFNQGAAKALGGYDDSRHTWEHLMHSLDLATQRLCAPSAHLMFWFSMRKGAERLYEPTAHRLEAIGWTVNPMPLIWVKSDGVGILPDPERGPRQIYETCFLCSRGDRKIVRAKSNAYSSPTDSKFHMSTKPEPMLRYFFEMLVDENTVLLDPTCGSGSALRAAESLGAKYVLGVEANPEWAEQAREELARFRKLRKATREE